MILCLYNTCFWVKYVNTLISFCYVITLCQFHLSAIHHNFPLVRLCFVTKNLICFWWDYHNWLCLLIFFSIVSYTFGCMMLEYMENVLFFLFISLSLFSQGKVNLRKISLTISQSIKADKFLRSREKSWWGIRKLA